MMDDVPDDTSPPAAERNRTGRKRGLQTLRISLAEMAALVAATASLFAFHREATRTIVAPAGANSVVETLGGPTVAMALLTLSGLTVGALRRATLARTALGMAIVASALSGYGALRAAGLGPIWLPLFLGLTVAGPLWLSRVTPPEASRVPGFSLNLARASRLGLDASLTFAAFVVATIPADLLDRLMPGAPPGVTAFSVPLASPSFVIQAVANVPPPPSMAAPLQFGWSEAAPPPPPDPFPIDVSGLPTPPVPELSSPPPG